VSGRSIFHCPPAVADAPEPLELLPERPEELLPDVLERSAVEEPAPLELLPMPLVLPPLLDVP
jgi:hypothetical protein